MHLGFEQALDVYGRSHLAPKRWGGGSALVRCDGTYTYLELRDELGRYPQSRAAYLDVARREDAIVYALALGLTLVATAGVDHLRAGGGGDGVLGSTGRAAMYATGGAIGLGSAIVGLRDRDRVPELATRYNSELRADLGLTQQDTRAVEPLPCR